LILIPELLFEYGPVCKLFLCYLVSLRWTPLVGQYFALNVFRLIDREEGLFNLNESLCEKMKEINDGLDENPITIKMKLGVVVSDPYLANKCPELYY